MIFEAQKQIIKISSFDNRSGEEREKYRTLIKYEKNDLIKEQRYGSDIHTPESLRTYEYEYY